MEDHSKMKKIYQKMFAEIAKKKLLTNAVLLRLENANSFSAKIEICKILINSFHYSIAEIEEIREYFKNDIYFNKKILSNLRTLSSKEERIKYCHQLIDTKRALIILKNQSEQLKIKFTYDINFALNNINEIKLSVLYRKIENNITSHRNAIKNSVKIATKKKSKKSKKKKIKTPYESGFTTKSIRAITTPMYS